MKPTNLNQPQAATLHRFLTQNNRGWLSTLEKRFFFWGLLGLLRFLSDVVGVPTFVTPIDYRSDFVD